MSLDRARALAVLRDGRVRVLDTRSDPSTLRVVSVTALVKSSRSDHRYCVDLTPAGWQCTCTSAQPCAHISAVQLITGHAPAALLRPTRAVS